MQSRYDIGECNEINITPIFVEIANELRTRFIGPVTNEVFMINYRLTGCIDTIIGTQGLEFKTGIAKDSHSMQAWLYHVLYEHHINPIVINLQSGTVTAVTSSSSIQKWKYILNAYTQLRTHIDVVQHRLTKLINKGYIPSSLDHNTFTVDTEFAGIGVIFDLAVVNINDPYSSLVQTISVSPEYLPFASEWLHEPRELFETSPSLVEVQDLFYYLQRLHSSSQVQLYHYVSPVDVSWWNGININLGSSAREKALKSGIFISGSAPPKLGTFYSQICHPLDFQPHLNPHTALSDALMLYELKVCGYL